MKISEKRVFALTNPEGDVPPSTRLIVRTIATWLDKMLPWVDKLARESKLNDAVMMDCRILKINVGRQAGHTFALKAIANLYANEIVILVDGNRMIKVHGFDKIPGIKVYSIFSIEKMLDDESLKNRILFCDISPEYLYRNKAWSKLHQFGFKAIAVIG